jgi:hypothetical protein
MKRRFFFHYRKSDGKMTIHYNKRCYIVDEVQCLVSCESKRNMRQPRVVMQGYCNKVNITTDLGYGKLIGQIL